MLKLNGWQRWVLCLVALGVSSSSGCALTRWIPNNYMCPRPGVTAEPCQDVELPPATGDAANVVFEAPMPQMTPAGDLSEIYQQLESLTASVDEMREQLAKLDVTAEKGRVRQAGFEDQLRDYEGQFGTLEQSIKTHQVALRDLNQLVGEQQIQSNQILTTVERHLDDALQQYEE